MTFCARPVKGNKPDRLKVSSLGRRLNPQWRIYEDWGKLGCVATSCGGQWLGILADNNTWKCGGCKLHFHKGCQQQPPPEDGVMGLRCASCVILKSQFIKEWQLQQPPPPEVVVAAAISFPADEKKRRGPIALARSHVHQLYKLRCHAATRPASLLAAGANSWAASPAARRY